MSTVNSPSPSSEFQLPPFPPFPTAKRYVPVGSQQDAVARISRAIEAFEGLSMVIGPPGTGKSLIASVLADRFADKREAVTLGDATISSSASLMRYLVHRLHDQRGTEPVEFPTEDALQLGLIAMLAAGGGSHPALLLLIDEAQTLAPEVLETLRILTNVMHEGRPRITAVLLGGPKLDETLAAPSLESFVQRIATRCYLHAFNPDETISYVHQVIRECGSNPGETIDDATIRMVHRACGGVPRLINQLMTASIDAAASLGRAAIDGAIVDQAWATLQQLPGPLMTEPEMSEPRAVEFGPLPDHDSAIEDLTPENEACVLEPEPTKAAPAETSIGMKFDDTKVGKDEAGESSFEMIEDESPELLENYTTQTQWIDETSSAAAIGPDVLGTVSIDCNVSGDLTEEIFGAIDVVNESTDDAAPAPEDLFGEFEDEEVLPSPSEQAAHGSSALASDVTSVDDLEKSLHAEILSLRGAASEMQASHETKSAADTEVEAPMSPEATENAPMMWLADESEASLEDEIVVDDRDMIVIEDDIRVEDGELINELAADDAEPEVVSVDFHGMLAKMRNPNA
ncbi:MAG: AAA family ATPase [Planctomycetota bacterium]